MEIDAGPAVSGFIPLSYSTDIVTILKLLSMHYFDGPVVHGAMG